MEKNNTLVLATIGSLGDLHPFIAIALSLKEMGFHPIIAAPEDHLEKIRHAGIQAYSIMPRFDEITTIFNMSEQQFAQKIMVDSDFLIGKVMLGFLDQMIEKLSHVAQGASAIVGSSYMFAAPIVAEKYHIPFIPAVLQPISMFSAYDPPVSPELALFKQQPKHTIAITWNKCLMTILSSVMRLRYGRIINAARKKHALLITQCAPVTQLEPSFPLVLGLYADVFGPKQPDHHHKTKITGFPVFDSDSGHHETMDQELRDFLNTDKPVIVFTLGSFAVFAPGDFYEESFALCQALRIRAVFLTGQDDASFADKNILSRRYIPHSLVFPNADLIVHHGGIGTTGQAMRAGTPQVVVPHLGDQWDNGTRIERLGLGKMITVKHYKLPIIKPIFTDLLANKKIINNAAQVADSLNQYNAASQAALAIKNII